MGQFHQPTLTALRAQISKEQQRQSSCNSFFALSGSARVKAACRMLMKLTPGVNFINLKCSNFTYACRSAAFL